MKKKLTKIACVPKKSVGFKLKLYLVSAYASKNMCSLFRDKDVKVADSPLSNLIWILENFSAQIYRHPLPSSGWSSWILQ